MMEHSNETKITKQIESSTALQLDSPSPPAVHSLPSELLLEIFVAGSSQPPSEVGINAVPFPILVSMVCKFWRNVAINSPCLWSTIFLPSTTKFDVLTFFERSKPAPFDVTLDTMVASSFGDGSSFDCISRTILDNICRLRSLKINVWSAEDLRSLVASFRDAEAPMLNNLEVFVYTQEESHDSRNGLPIMTHTVALKSLKVKGVCGYCSPPLINLTFLDIDRFKPSESQFRDLFDACPSLSSLILRRFAAREDAVFDQASLPIHASSLRSFAVSFTSGHSSPCACPLHLLVLENVECIEIFLLSLDLSGHFSSSLRSWRQNYRVRKLRMSGISIEAEELLFIQSLPNTIDLELINIYTNSDFYLPSVISLPNLHSITLEVMNKEAGVTGVADLSWFSRVVGQRLVKPTSPLTACFSKLDEGDDQIQKIAEILGGHLTVQYSARKNALIESNAFEFLEEGEEDDWDYYDDESDFDASYELDVENEYGYDDEDEDFW